jgi:hypothetical protein
MPGLGDSWGTREEMLHPRDKGGRFRTKWKMPESVVNRIQAFLAAFSPRQFQSDNQSAQYLQNKAKPARFSSGAGYHRLHVDYDEANEALRRGDMDPETRKFVKQMDDSAITTTDDLILTRTVDPEAFGLNAQNVNAEDGGIEDLTGKLIADRGYSAANIGTPMGMGPGRVQMTIATPKGTKLIIPSRSGTDRGVFLDRDQPVRVTKVTPDGKGGWYVMAIAEPHRGNETPPIDARPARGVGLTPQQRAERVGAPSQRKSTEAPNVGAGAPVTQQTIDEQNRPTPQVPSPGGPPPRDGEPIHAESIGGGGPAPSSGTAEVAQAPAQATPAAPGATPAVQQPNAGEVTPPAPAAAVPDADLEKVKQRTAARKRFRAMAKSVPAAQAVQEMDELDKKGASNKHKAESLRAIARDPAMEELSKEDRDDLAAKLESAAADFERDKPNQGRAKLAQIARGADVEARGKAGDTVDFDGSSMDPVADTVPEGRVKLIKAPVVHVDPDTGKETVISKGLVGSPDEGAPSAPRSPNAGGGGGAAPEAPSAPAAAPAVPAPVKKATPKKAQFTPEQEDRIVSRAKSLPEVPRNSEEERIKRQAAEIEARRNGTTPAPVKKAVPSKATAERLAAKKAPAKKAAPESSADMLSRLSAMDSREAALAELDGVPKAQLAKMARELSVPRAGSMDTDQLKREVVEGTVGQRLDREAIGGIARGMMRTGAPEAPAAKKAVPKVAAPAKAIPEKKAPAKKAAPKSGMDLLQEQEDHKLEVARKRGEKERAQKAREDERAARKSAAEEAKKTRATERAEAKKTAPAKKAAPKKEVPAKELTPEQKRAAEVQARADEAGLPTTVKDLRARAKEEGIKGFSTMTKEKLQRALLGEEVSTGTTKLNVVSPEKMVGHLQRVDSHNDAEKLLEKHAVKDLRELADFQGLETKGVRTKARLKDMILEEARGKRPTDFEPVSPKDAIKIDANIPDGDAGDGMRRAMSDVDMDDPDSLLRQSESLEEQAKKLRADGDRSNANLYQDLSDQMGMRAQQISGMEVVPKKPPVKRAAKKAVPKKRTEAEIRTMLGPVLTDELLAKAGDHERQRKDAAKLMEAIAAGAPDSGVGKAAKKAAAELKAPTKKATPKVSVEDRVATRLMERIEEVNPDVAKGIRADMTPAEREEVDAAALRVRMERLAKATAPPAPREARAARVAKALSEPVPSQEGRIRPNGRIPAGRLQKGDRLYVEKAGDGWRPTTRKTGTTQITVDRTERVATTRGFQRSTNRIAVIGHDDDGNEIRVDRLGAADGGARGFPGHQTFLTAPAPGATPAKKVTKKAAAAAAEDSAVSGIRKLAEGTTPQERAGLPPAPGTEGGPPAADLDKMTKAELLKQAATEDVTTVKPSWSKDKIKQEIHTSRDLRAGAQKVTTEGGGIQPKQALPSPAEAKAAQARVDAAKEVAARRVPEGSLEGPHAQKPVQNAARVEGFNDAWDKAGIKSTDDAAGRSVQEVRGDIASGRLSPEEGVRRLESDIKFNEDDIAEMDAQLRQPMDISERKELRERKEALEDAVDEQKKASTFIREHFKSEPVVTPRVIELELPADISEKLRHTDPEELKAEARAQGIKAEGDTPLEVATSIIRDMAAKKLAKKAAPAKKLAKATPKVDPADPGKPDVRAIGTGLDFTEDDKAILDAVQRDLDGPNPGRAAMNLEKRIRAREDLHAVEGEFDEDFRDDATKAELDRAATEAMASNQRFRELATRLRSVRRPTKKAAPAKAAKTAKAVPTPEADNLRARIQDIAIEQFQGAQSESAARTALGRLTIPELADVASKFGIPGGSRTQMTEALVARKMNPGGEVQLDPNKLSTKAQIPNNWGGGGGPVHYHSDGPIGTSLDRMGPERGMEVDGDRLDNVVGRLATDSVMGRITTEEMLDRFRALRDRLPAGSRAFAGLTDMIQRTDAPAVAPPPLPDVAPAPVKRLMEEFSRNPIARGENMGGRQGPSIMQRLKQVTEQIAERYQGRPQQYLHWEDELRKLEQSFHESNGAEGRFELGRSIAKAIKDLDALRDAERRARASKALGATITRADRFAALVSV